METNLQPIMRAEHITKQYPGTTALKDVSFNVYPGKVNVLIGENGAGKSTLMKILAGIEHPTSGSIFLEGEEVHFGNTREAAAAGVGIIHQELSLFPDMTVADNMFAGCEISHHGVIDRKAQCKRAEEVMRNLQQEINPREMMRNLRVGQQQVVEIGKKMLNPLKVLIMDEPTSSLSTKEVEALFKLINDLKSRGIAIIYISHRLEEIIRIGDFLTILRDGHWVADANVSDISVPWIVERMVGHGNLDVEKIPYTGEPKEILKVENYCLPRLGGGFTDDHVSFTLHKGEVLGFYGLMGAGRTELVESLMGLHADESTGKMWVDGEEVDHPVVSEQIARGMVLVPEDRQRDGLVQTMSIANNSLLTSIPHFTKNGVIDRKQCKAAVDETVKDMQIKVADVNHLVTALSGGNQQKVVIGKCVMAKAKIFMMDEPSRGIDVGAKTDIFRLMRRFSAQGQGVIFVGSELKEIMKVCDRVLVMSNGKITGEFVGDEITQDALVKASAANLHTGLDQMNKENLVAEGER